MFHFRRDIKKLDRIPQPPNIDMPESHVYQEESTY